MKTSRKSSGRTWVALIAIALVILCMTLFLTSCNNEPEQPVQPEQPAQPDQPAHTHTISTEWSSDDSDHWHEASCGDPSHNEDKAVHTWNAGVVTTPATELTDGVKTFTCTVCGKTKTQVIPAGHEHEYPDYWMYRQVTGDVQKYKVCTYCDEEITETAEYTDVFKVTEGAISCKWIDALERCEIITGDWTIPSVVGSDAVTKIYDAAFYGETGLTSVEIPSSVTRIGYSAFEGCDNLSSITIPASVTTIDGNLLSYCNAPVQITIDAGNPNFCISDGMLFNKDKTVLISGLNKGGSITVPDGVTEIGEGAFDLNAAVTDVVLPDSVTTIGYGAFFECENLESINIPVATVAISDDVFSYCSSLTSIDVAASNPNYSSEDGALYNKTKTELLTYPSASGAVSIRDGVTSIARSAMQGCSAVTSLVIPNSVTHIDHYSFEGCSEITSLTIPDSVTEIGAEAIPAGTTVVGYSGTYAQQYCAQMGLSFKVRNDQYAPETTTAPEGQRALAQRRKDVGAVVACVAAGVLGIGAAVGLYIIRSGREDEDDEPVPDEDEPDGEFPKEDDAADEPEEPEEPEEAE